MSSTPRSVLKKRTGLHDDRRVSFAVPLSYGKDAPKKKPPVSKSTPATKKSKSSEDLVDIISLNNKQSEILESIFDVESKFAKQSRQTQEMTNELITFAESVATMSSESAKLQSMLAEQQEVLAAVEKQRDELIERTVAASKQLETRTSAQEQYFSTLAELRRMIETIDWSKMDDPESQEEFHVDYDHFVALVEKLDEFLNCASF